jgi:hypothetical protein
MPEKSTNREEIVQSYKKSLFEYAWFLIPYSTITVTSAYLLTRGLPMVDLVDEEERQNGVETYRDLSKMSLIAGGLFTATFSVAALGRTAGFILRLNRLEDPATEPNGHLRRPPRSYIDVNTGKPNQRGERRYNNALSLVIFAQSGLVELDPYAVAYSQAILENPTIPDAELEMEARRQMIESSATDTDGFSGEFREDLGQS